jgi:lipopolysaccharide transport system ATP-binding protein
MSDIIITAENLSKSYLVGHQSSARERYSALRDVLAREARNIARKGLDFVRGRQIVQGDEVEEFWALRDVSFDVNRGEVLGIIGHNGAGKSTLLKILSRITEPTRGRVTIRGRAASLLEVGTGFHPELTGRENIYLNGAILGMPRSEIRKKFDEIVAFAETERFLDTPVKRYSSGMYVRLAFAIAAHLEPEVLIVDEVLAVGDAEFQKKCLGKMREVSGKNGRTVLFVSHNLSAVRELCSRAILIERGEVKREGSVTQVLEEYFSNFTANAEIDIKPEKLLGPQQYSKLRKLQLLDGSGLPTTIFIMNQPLVARILVEITQPVQKVEVGLKVSTRFGAAVHYFTSSWEGLYPNLEPGLHWFEVRVPALAVFPGTYNISLWVSRASEWSDVNVQNITSFSVLKANVTGYPTRMEEYVVSGGEVYAPSEWKLLPAGSAKEIGSA